MAKHSSDMEDSNRSGNSSIHEVSAPDRRTVLRGSLAATLATLMPMTAALAARTLPAGTPPLGSAPLIGFKSVAVSTSDTVVVPEGYSATVGFPWGDPVGIPGNMPAWKTNASNSAADQEAQIGMHHDGMHYFPLDGSRRGLLVINHEYTDDGLLHTDGMNTWTAEKCANQSPPTGSASSR
jgi:secreted PhoX family phosphatase